MAVCLCVPSCIVEYEITLTSLQVLGWVVGPERLLLQLAVSQHGCGILGQDYLLKCRLFLLI